MSKNFSVFTIFKAKDGLTPAFKSMTKGSNSLYSAINKTSNRLNVFSTSIQRTCGKINTVFNAAIGYFAIDTVKEKINSFIDSASDLQETIGKTGEVFKANSGDVENWAKTSIKNMGLAEQTALDTAALYGDMGTGMGMTTKRASEMAMSLTQLSADMASFKNVEQGLAANALKGIFTGETEALKNMGVVMTETVLQEYAKAAGIRKKMKDMTQAEKIELRYQYVMKSTKNAQGDFVRTFGNYANQKRVGEELRKQAEINIGKILLPTWNKFMVLFNTFFTNNLDKITTNFEKFFNYLKGLFKSFGPVFDELKKTVQIFSKNVGPAVLELAPVFETVFKNLLIPALVVTIGAFNKLLTGIITTCNVIKIIFLPIFPVLTGALTGLCVYKAVQFFQMLHVQMALCHAEITKNLIPSILKTIPIIWNQTAALLANPLFYIPAIIAGLITLIVILYKNWDKITQAISNFGEKCKNVFISIISIAKTCFLNSLFPIFSFINFIIEKIETLGNKLNSLKVFKNVFNETSAKTPNFNAQPPINKNIYQNKSEFGGVIEVRNIVENKNNSFISSSTDLIQSHGLKLNPGY